LIATVAVRLMGGYGSMENVGAGRSAWVLGMVVVLAGMMGCSNDTAVVVPQQETPDGSATDTEALAAGLRLVDGSDVVVPPVALPRIVGGEQSSGEWEAVLKVDHDPLEVFDGYVRQLEDMGLDLLGSARWPCFVDHVSPEGSVLLSSIDDPIPEGDRVQSVVCDVSGRSELPVTYMRVRLVPVEVDDGWWLLLSGGTPEDVERGARPSSTALDYERPQGPMPTVSPASPPTSALTELPLLRGYPRNVMAIGGDQVLVGAQRAQPDQGACQFAWIRGPGSPRSLVDRYTDLVLEPWPRDVVYGTVDDRSAGAAAHWQVLGGGPSYELGAVADHDQSILRIIECQG
jgi:hypothetical protein